jgi:hypothetical protein
MPFDNWNKRREIAAKYATVKERAAAVAALKINFSQPQPEDEGYYRKPQTEPVLGANGQPNGQKRVIGFEPVAYFMKDGILQGAIGKRRMTPEEVSDEGLWSWVVNRPISYEWWQAAVKGEPWPDLQKIEETLKNSAAAIPAANREVTSSDNAPPEGVEPHIYHAELIENAIRASRDLLVTDEASAAILLGAKNRVAELRLAADKAGHAIYDPLHAAYKAEQVKWPGMVKKAADWETTLNRRYLEWRDAENRRIAREKADAAQRQAEIDAANARAADRAIAQGQPEPAPVVPEPTQDTAAAPTPVSATYRAPGQRAKPKEVETWHLDGIDDFDAVYKHFKDNADVKAALTKVATATIKSGQEVPGTRRHYGLI